MAGQPHRLPEGRVRVQSGMCLDKCFLLFGWLKKQRRKKPQVLRSHPSRKRRGCQGPVAQDDSEKRQQKKRTAPWWSFLGGPSGSFWLYFYFIGLRKFTCIRGGSFLHME